MTHRQSTSTEQYDLAVAGGGIAGLTAALTAGDQGARVLMLSKGPLLASTSYYAQGGIAAAVGEDDSPELHVLDTLAAGRGLCRESAVRVLVGDAPARIDELRSRGVRFDDGLGLEGGHSRRRVLHVAGAETGRMVAEQLAADAAAHPLIDVVEGECVLALWVFEGRCVGVVTGARAVRARATLLATGGAAALWARTTNPRGAVGDAIVMAFRAGAAIADLEFVQFHPTALRDTGFLLSEALRGEGALLLDAQGDRFVDELAPRDVVARAIAARGAVLLDLRPIDRSRFPSLMAPIAEAGYDPAAEPVPVAPAAHYTMGGVVTDADGRTEVAGLFAAGECACTGVHGANRLASNSMLECLIFGHRGALAALAEPAAGESGKAPIVEEQPPVSEEVRRAVWKDAGLVRDASGLERLLGSPHSLARLVAESALARRESRGGHFRTDFPHEDSSLEGVHTVIRLGAAPSLEPWS